MVRRRSSESHCFTLNPIVLRSEGHQCQVTGDKIEKMEDCVLLMGYPFSEKGFMEIKKSIKKIDEGTTYHEKLNSEDRIYVQDYVLENCSGCHSTHHKGGVVLEFGSTSINLCFDCLSILRENLDDCEIDLNKDIKYSDKSGFAVIDTDTEIRTYDSIDETFVFTSNIVEIGCREYLRADLSNFSELYNGLKLYGGDLIGQRAPQSCHICFSDCGEVRTIGEYSKISIFLCTHCIKSLRYSMESFASQNNSYLISRTM